MRLFGFSATGKKKWQREIPEGKGDDNQSAHTVNLSTPSDTLIVTYKKPVGKSSIWPAPRVVEALDPATGRTLWKATSSWGATYGHIGLDDTVYTSACRGTQTGKRDECRLSARDPRTGRVRWTVPTGQVPSIVTGDATTLVLTTLPRGYRGNSWLTALDKRTGARLGLHVAIPRFAGRAVTDYSSRTYLKGRTVAVTLSRANAEAERCDYVAAGRDVRTGDRVWRAAWRDPGCDHDRFSGSSAIPAVTADGKLTLRDPATGKIVWKGAVSGRVVTLDGRDVLVDSSEGLKLYGKARTWTLPDRPPGLPLLTRRRVLLAGQQETLVHDRRTGKLIASAKGDHAGAGDGWVATFGHNGDGTTTFVIYRV
ncbi:outer membrane protein assembly factor BamB family protein [Nonomuraea sp. SBT364]|uniref:outer membrane protein assembly factor BamB family protein n=1 Tax=Nonomuraea sp. SBT364 TaxID=1580530 RepID=UPI00066B73E1